MSSSNTGELSPRARAKRDHIRGAAQRLFLKGGYSGTSTDAIASEAGVSKQTLYAYYPSKEDLLADVLLHLIGDDRRLDEAARDGAGELASAGEVRQALLALADAFIAGLMQPDYLAMVRVVVAETPRLPALGNRFAATVPERIFSRVTAILQRGQASGAIAAVDLDAAARLFVGSLLTYAILDGLLVGDAPPRPPAPERITAIVELFMRAVGGRG